MIKLDMRTLVEIERECSTDVGLQYIISWVLSKNIAYSEFVFCEDSVSEAWGDFYCLAAELISD